MIWEFRLEETVIEHIKWEELEGDLNKMLEEFNRKVVRDIKTAKEHFEQWRPSSKDQ